MTEDQSKEKFSEEVKIITELFLKDAPEDMKQLYYEQQITKNGRTRRNTKKRRKHDENT